jgi:hypothetical protein
MVLRTASFSGRAAAVTQKLNEAAQEGWELVNGGDIFLYFRREKQ